MRIGLEAQRANLPNPTGVERYAAELIKHLAKIDHKNEYILYFRTPPAQWFLELPANFKCKVMPFPKFWTQIRLSWETIIHPVDVMMILASALPIIHPKNSIATVHDIAFEMFPKAFTTFMRKYLQWSTRFAVKSARKIVSVSQSTKNDLVRIYGADAKKIEVIHLGFDASQYSPKKYEQVQPILDKWNLVFQKYILFVGTLQPRKNILKLIEAFDLLRKKNRIEEKLVIVGGKGWLWEPIMNKIESVKDGSIVYLQYLSNEDLKVVFSGASLLTLPALYEGFGLPPLEAMASGVPVVVSNISSLPEVVGDAGRLVEPDSVDSIAEGILEVLTNQNLRVQMIENGLLQAKKFTWEECARKTLALIESLKP
jgi:glycosyltransferase involved in cell wall biosynthesis